MLSHNSKTISGQAKAIAEELLEKAENVGLQADLHCISSTEKKVCYCLALSFIYVSLHSLYCGEFVPKLHCTGFNSNLYVNMFQYLNRLPICICIYVTVNL